MKLSKTEMLKFLKRHGWQAHGLEEEFSKFETKYLEGGTTGVSETPRFEKFEWVNDDGNKVSADIAIQHRVSGDDMQEFDYILDTWEPPYPEHAVPTLVGVQEVGQILGWGKSRVSEYVKRGKLPEPVQRLAAGPLWRRSDIEKFKGEIS